MLPCDVDDVQPTTGFFDGDLRIGALVVTRKLGEPAVKALPGAPFRLVSENGNQAGVNPTGNISANRDVAAQVRTDRLVEQFDEAVLEIAGLWS